MSGHSKWATIKHKKAAVDAKRGKVFSKLAKEITICTRSGGGDPASNITLRTLLNKARSVNMPADNIDRAIKKGTGELQSAAIEEVMFEAYVSGIGVIIQALSDNRNRTVAEVRHVITRHAGSLAGQGQLMRAFQRKGQIVVDASKSDEEKLMELALEAGAEDMTQENGQFEIITEPAKFAEVVDALNKAGVPMESQEITLLPDSYVEITDPAKAKAVMSFIDAMEELEDVQNVYTNFDIDPALLENMST